MLSLQSVLATMVVQEMVGYSLGPRSTLRDADEDACMCVPEGSGMVPFSLVQGPYLRTVDLVVSRARSQPWQQRNGYR